MSGIINQIGSKSGIISGGGAPTTATGTVSNRGMNQLIYEEGTFTLSATAGGIASQTSTYVRIGNMVSVSITLAYNGGSVAGHMTGLPFTNRYTTAVAYMAYFTEAENGVAPILQAGGDTTGIDTYMYLDNSLSTMYQSSGNLRCGFTYQIKV